MPSTILRHKVIRTVIHLAAWLCFLMIPFVFYPRPRDISFFTERYFSGFFIFNNILLISFYYLNTYFLIPRWLDHKKFFVYGIIILTLLVFFGCFPRLYHLFFGSAQPPAGSLRPPEGRQRNFQQPLLAPGNIAVFLLIFVFSTGINIINQWLRSEQRNKEIANEKLQAELSFLKAQINPHFLFNTLNNIYALASSQSELTAPAVMKLSSIMRYVLTEASNDMVPLDKEIQFTTHYLELQKMRLTNKSSVTFTVKGDPRGRQVAPLLLLPFVENAFKYGISTREQSPITLLLDIGKDSIHFNISNFKHLNTSQRLLENTGIGIHNTRRRLDLLYPGRYELQIDDQDLQYIVSLDIQF